MVTKEEKKIMQLKKSIKKKLVKKKKFEASLEKPKKKNGRPLKQKIETKEKNKILPESLKKTPNFRISLTPAQASIK